MASLADTDKKFTVDIHYPVSNDSEVIQWTNEEIGLHNIVDYWWDSSRKPNHYRMVVKTCDREFLMLIKLKFADVVVYDATN